MASVQPELHQAGLHTASGCASGAHARNAHADPAPARRGFRRILTQVRPHDLTRKLLLLGTALCTPLALSQTGQAQLASAFHAAHTRPASRGQPVTFTADTVAYDRDNGLVTAAGHVEAWQNDHVLRADKVTFDRNTNVAAASGHVVLVEPDGQVLFSDYAELTQGMREGVLRGMRAILAQNGRLVANGARRIDGKINEMSRAIYSTCNLCKNDPEAAPLWQLRARRITEDKQNETIEYQDAFLDVYGVPVAYFPWFSHADPSVKRESGFLVPSFGGSSHLGEFASIPYYWVIDGQSDAILTPTVSTGAIANLDVRYRRRFNNGTVSIDGSFGYDRGTDADSSLGYTPNGMQAAILAKGVFDYNDEWRYGFDIERATSPEYIRDYNLKNYSEDVLTSQVYLEGFGVGSYARLDAKAYQGLDTTISQSNLPYVLPRYQYSYFGEPDAWGGRLSIDTSAYDVYREIGTKDQRGAITANYVRPFTGDIGDLYNVTLHVDAAAYNADDLNQQPNFASSTTSDIARALPQIAWNARWPLVRSDAGTGTQTIEPIAQLIAAPNPGNSKNGLIPNEDSFDFEFSDANLFAFNRYPGIDRLEGGVRANYALHGAWTVGSTNLDGLIGESYRFHKDDTYPIGSGLASNASDIVARASITPASWLDLTYRTRLDHNNMDVHMADAIATVGEPIFRLSGGYTYDIVDPYYFYDQATIPASYFTPRNEVTLGASTQFGRYKLAGTVRRDLQNNQLISAGAQGSYEDECFIFSGLLNRRYTSIDNDHGDTTVLFQVTFKTVGQIGFSAF